jgi:hypothetical protein
MAWVSRHRSNDSGKGQGSVRRDRQKAGAKKTAVRCAVPVGVEGGSNGYEV